MLKGNVKLIGISGAAGSGKSRLSQALQGQFSYIPVSFAYDLKKMLQALPFMHEENFKDRIWKEVTHPFYGCSPRHLMQTLGTEWGRNLVHPDIWVLITGTRIEAKWMVNKAFDAYVFDDLRFDNEAEWIKKQGGITVKVSRVQDQLVKAHSSEAGISKEFIDVYVNNYTTIEDLCGRASGLDSLAMEARDKAAA